MAGFQIPNQQAVEATKAIWLVIMSCVPREQLREVIADISYGWHRGKRRELDDTNASAERQYNEAQDAKEEPPVEVERKLSKKRPPK